jgi:hypothetical protein
LRRGPVHRRLLASTGLTGLRIRSGVKAGPRHRAELDHVGTYNFMVEVG